MKFFGNNKVTRFLEDYHPYASLITLLAIEGSKYYNPDTFNGFTDLSYETSMKRGDTEHVHYKKGWDDAMFVFFYFNVVTVIRFLYRKLVLEPIARKIRLSKGLSLKFIDAGWFSLFYLVATGWGIYIFHDDDWWFNTRHLWDGYPHPFDYRTKQYYLVSLAFWLQCLFSFFFEAPRKDDKAFFFHHLLTIGLMLSSYHFNFFRVGAAILMEQNAADVLYYSAKLFKYSRKDNFATAILVCFVFVWIYTRHYIFGLILYSLWFELPLYLNAPGWDSETGYYYADWLWHCFSVALVSLQLLMIYWFFLICRVVYRGIVGGEIADTTDVSDSDEEELVKNGADVKKNKQKKHAKASKADIKKER